jgi:DNA-binding transcriptional regulator YhcF (GntR family)
MTEKQFNADALYAWLAANPANCRASMKEMSDIFGVSITMINGALHELIGSGQIEKKKGTHRNISIVEAK